MLLVGREPYVFDRRKTHDRVEGSGVLPFLDARLDASQPRMRKRVAARVEGYYIVAERGERQGQRALSGANVEDCGAGR